jgi:hypothetical protein
MKHYLIAVCLALAGSSTALAADLFILPDGSMDTLPEKGMQVYEPPATKGQAAISISTENPARGTGALKIACDSGVYASVSFPMSTARTTGRARVYLRGELTEADQITIGVQSFTMAGGFKSVSLVPVMDAKARIGTDWQHITFDLKRDEAATHWQLSFVLKGPGVLWIDHLEEVVE